MFKAGKLDKAFVWTWTKRLGALSGAAYFGNQLWQECSPLSLYHSPNWERHALTRDLPSYKHNNITQFLHNNTSMIVLQLEPQNLYFEKPSLLVCNPICLNEDQMREIDNVGKVDAILIPNRGCRKDIKAWTERYPKAITICPSKIFDAVNRITTVDQTTEKLFTKKGGWRGIKMFQPHGIRGFASDQIYEYDQDCILEENEKTSESKKAMLVTGVLGYFTPSSNFIRNYFLRATTAAPTLSMVNQRALLSLPTKYGSWLKLLSDDINPEILIVQNQSHPSPPETPFFTKVNDAISHTVYDIIGAKVTSDLFRSFPDLSVEEQIIELDKKIEQVKKEGINMN